MIDDEESADDHSQAVDVARVLLRRDLFASVRTDAQLEHLVAGAVATIPQPYTMLLCRLLGYYPRLPETESEALWAKIVAHRADLTRQLGRSVHLRVAALDLLALGEMPEEIGVPILLGPRVLRGILGPAKR